MRAAYFYPALCAFALGIAVATLVPLTYSAVALPLVIAFAWWVLGRERRARDRLPFAPLLIIGIVVTVSFALGAARLLVAEHDTAPSQFAAEVGQVVTLTGVVSAEPDVRATNELLTFRTGGVGFQARVDRNTYVQYDDTVSVTGKLGLPKAFATDYGRTFHYPEYLKARGVSYTLSYADVTSDTPPTHFSYRRWLLGFKQQFLTSIDRYIPEPAAGLGGGLLLGVQSGLGNSLQQAFRTTGVIHIVVLSGYNIMLVVTFIMYVFSFFLPYRLRLVFGLFSVTSFALIVGLSATVVRASIMAGTLLFLKLHGQTYHVLRALFLAAFIMLLINPYLLLFDPGFQLSFMATLALILVAPHVEAWVAWLPTWGGVREFVTATVATQLFVTPLLLYLIGQFSVVAIIVNVLVLPMVPIAMLLTFLTGLLGLVAPPLAALVGFVAYLSLAYILRIVTAFASFPFAAFIVPPFPVWVLVAAYVLIGYLIWRRLQPRRHTRTAVRHWTIVETDTLRKQKSVEAHGASTDPVPVFFQ